MKTKIILSALALIFTLSASAQKPTIQLTFTAIDNTTYVQLDSIKVMNLTQENDTVLYWPDTTLMLNYQVGITEIYSREEKLQVFQNYPNPVKDQTTITLYLPEEGNVNLVITDILGHQLINTKKKLKQGVHSFRYTPSGGEIFFFTAYWKSTSSSIKILKHETSSGTINSLKYIGSNEKKQLFKNTKDRQGFSYNLGDDLLFIGYAYTLQSGMIDSPESDDTYALQFATNIPCPDAPTVEYEGQTYNTIQICGQCWLKENLNVGTMINSSDNMEDNDLKEKYCYDNNPVNCDTFGGLYQAREVIQYASEQGAQGICPDGWHVPTDNEWKVLEGIVDSQYDIGDPEWENNSWRGFDAAAKLKSANYWNNNGNGTDDYGFSGFPWGYSTGSGSFFGFGTDATWWTSSECNSMYTWFRDLYWSNNTVLRGCGDRNPGRSVRCIKN